MIRKDLRPFDMERLNEIRELRKSRMQGKSYSSSGENSSFFDELEDILKKRIREEKPINNEWQKKEQTGVVRGEIWYQRIGEYAYDNTLHVFEYMYVKSEDIVVDKHGHDIKVMIHNNLQTMKVREFYIFEDGKIKMCRKNEKHKLVNHYGRPIYVISLKIYGKGIRNSNMLDNLII